MAHCKTAFFDLILATTGPWWSIVRQRFSTLSLPLLDRGGPLQGRVYRPYPCHYWTVVAHCKAEFFDLILATTGRWWPIAGQSFSILSYPCLFPFTNKICIDESNETIFDFIFISVLPPHVNIITIHGWEISFLIRSLHVELYLNNLRKRYPGCKCSFTLSQHYVN